MNPLSQPFDQLPVRANSDPERAGAVGRLRLPLVLIDLEDLTVLGASAAATSLMGVSANSVLRHSVLDFLPDSARTSAEAALGAVRAGFIDHYNAHRRLRMNRSLQTSANLWVRAVQFRGRRLALTEIAHRQDQRHSALVEYFGREPVDMTIGTIDADWTVTAISDDDSNFSDLIDQKMSSVVAEPDAETLIRAASQVRDGNSAVLPVRLRCGDKTWKTMSCVVTPLAGTDTRCFIITGEQFRPDHAARLSKLERHLRNIAAEVDASRVLHSTAGGPGRTRFAQTLELSRRQSEVMTMFTAGARVPTIAKQLFISQSTVRNHLSAIFEQFGVHSQAELIALLNETDAQSGGMDGVSI